MEPRETWRALAEALLGKSDRTSLDVARESGVEPDDLRRLWQALGFPPVATDERRFTRADVDAVRAVRALVDAQRADPGDVVRLTRVIGHAMARVSDAQITTIAERLHARRWEWRREPAPSGRARDPDRSPGPGTRGVSWATPWRRHLVAAVLQLSAAPSAVDRPLIVGFADLVGFTSMSRALDSQQLARTVDRFEAVAHEAILTRGGRVVKIVGDEVMFSVDDAAPAAEIALALVDGHAKDDDLPDVRVGVASGPTLAWEGDLFGPTVDLASRLADFAQPGTVVLSEELGTCLQAQGGFELRHLRPMEAEGRGAASRTWVVRRAG